ncbi:MAG: hypothetical protein ACOYNL_08335 [Rickettsiales bacterium]
MNLNALHVGVIDSPDNPDFDKIYECYSKVFTLPSERESKENFIEVLKRNADPEVQASKAKEMWIYLRDRSGRVVGASNIDVFAGSSGRGVDGTLQGIYTFVDPDYRNKGVFTRLVAEREKAAVNFCKQHYPNVADPQVITFVEQNSPMLMTAEEYLADNKAAGIDQCVRRTVFEKAGFRTAGFRYIQPDLEAVGGKGKCEYLDMQIKARTGSIPAATIREHLSRFFKLSFPAGTAIENSGLEAMNNSLPPKGEIHLAPPGMFATLSSTVVNENTLIKLKPEERHLPLHQALAPYFPMLSRVTKRMPGISIIGNGINTTDGASRAG